MNSTVDLCFLCLTNIKNLKSILFKKSERSVIEKKCRYVLNKHMNIKSGVSYHICLKCLRNLNYTYNFKQMCLQNLRKFNNYIETLGTNKRLKVTITDLKYLKENELKCGNKLDNKISFPFDIVVKEEIADDYEDITLDKMQAMYKRDLQYKIEKELKCGSKSAKEISYPFDIVVKQEITDNYDDNDLEEEEAMHEYDKSPGNEIPENTGMHMQHSAISCGRVVETILKDVIVEFKSRDIHKKPHINDEPRDEQLLKATYSDSEHNSNDKLQKEEANPPDHNYSLPIYPVRTKTDLQMSSSAEFSGKEKPENINDYSNMQYNSSLCEGNFLKEAKKETGLKLIHEEIHMKDVDSQNNIIDKLQNQEANSTENLPRSSSYSENNKTVNSAQPVKKHKCDECDKAFPTRYSFRIHKLVHKKKKRRAKPHKCDECDKSFQTKGNLKVHKRLHTGERPFKCDICDKSFVYHLNLATHKQLFHKLFYTKKEMPHKCFMCEKHGHPQRGTKRGIIQHPQLIVNNSSQNS